MSAYPPIALSAVNALEAILANYKVQGRNYLEQSPYSPEIKAKLMVIASASVTAQKRKEQEDDLEADINVKLEMDSLFRSLKNFSVEDENLAATEKIAILRIQTSQLEKIIEMREKAIGIDQYVVFRETVMDFISRKFEPDDINELQDRLNLI